MNGRIIEPLAQSHGCTRRHAIKVFAAAAGGTLFGWPATRGFADVPWGEPEYSRMLSASGSPLRLGDGHAYAADLRQAGPTIAFDSKRGRLWTTWTRSTDHGDEIAARSFDTRGEEWGEIVALCHGPAGSDEIPLDSAATAVGTRLVVVWCAWSKRGWVLRSASLDCDTGEASTTRLIAGGTGEGAVHWHPAIASTGQSALVVWQAKPTPGSAFEVHGLFLGPEGTPMSDPFVIGRSPAQDCCRPHVAASPDGTEFAVVLDRQEGRGARQIDLVTIDAARGEAASPRTVSHHPATDTAASVAYSPDGAFIWMAWHSNREGTDGWGVRPWYRLVALRRADGRLLEPVPSADHDLPDERGTVQGFEFPRIVVSPTGAVGVLGRPSHGFYLQYYDHDGRSPLYRLPEDGWGGRGRLLHGAFDAADHLWVARRDLNTNVFQRIEGFENGSGPPPLEPIAAGSGPAVRILSGLRPHYVWPKEAGPSQDPPANEDLNVYFGDVHGHSWQSDGMGDPEDAYLRARDVYRDDFHVLTDHDRFVGKRLMDGQWEQQKTIADHYNTPGSFVTLYGQEWTTPRANLAHGWGHFNVYSADSRIPLFDHGDARSRDLPDLLSQLSPYAAFAIPHHIGWTGVRWDVWDDALIPVVEICSVHGVFEYEGNEPIRHRGGMKGCFARDGLAAGRKFGFVGGSDQHGLLWHHGVCWKPNPFRAGLTGLWAAELTRDALMEALHARRTFATTGVKLLPRLTVGGALPGQAVQVKAAPELRADVAVPPEEGRLAWIELVRNGDVIHRYGGEGQQSRFTFVDDQCPRDGTSYYYLRITLADRNMAWTSPIWVTRT